MFLDKSNGLYYIIVTAIILFVLLNYYVEYKNLKQNRYYNQVLDIIMVKNLMLNDLSNNCYNNTTFDYDSSFSSLGIPGYYRRLNNCTRNKEMKYILSYHRFWGMKMDGLFKKCPVNSCSITSNPDSLPVEVYDAVIFDNTKHIKPSMRFLFQKYIFFSTESPYNTHYLFDSPNFFNWTMTYRRDSDIHYPYRVIMKQKTNYKLPALENIKRKTKMAAWFVSNCVTAGTKRRQKYVEELQKFIQVDIYGACGTLKCKTNCYEMVEEDYLFYLSFENSMCFDYVTEKVFNILNYNIIPVVMGYADYDSITPPKSVINVDNFPTPKHLANYLLKIRDNPYLYLEYLKWKKDYVVDVASIYQSQYVFCQLCDLIHRPLNLFSYKSIKKWFMGFNCYEYSLIKKNKTVQKLKNLATNISETTSNLK